MTLRQRKLSKMLGEDWHDDYLRRRADGWSNAEIAAFYRIQIDHLSVSMLCRWARREIPEAERQRRKAERVKVAA